MSVREDVCEDVLKRIAEEHGVETMVLDWAILEEIVNMERWKREHGRDDRPAVPFTREGKITPYFSDDPKTIKAHMKSRREYWKKKLK